ncbi:hypothetical protein NDU88_008965 [Pleurodeles waltl]|uniref:Uncharacterized protein n=1 Tax=Pleurodeles waltl TaxID=8319 RepID=A0AAV7PTR5_PLEWA|nr:hypothetical protein NDU88_008965 [Pleurodeles waltl]
MLSTSVLAVQRYFLAMGVRPAPTPPMAARSVAPSSVPSGALQRTLRQAGARPPLNVLCKSHGGALCASLLVPQCYFLIADVGPASTPPADRALFRVLSARGCFYPMHCSVFSAKPVGGRPSTSSTSPLGPCSVPRSSFPSVASSMWMPGLCRHRRWPAHSIAPLACSLLGQGEATPRCSLQVPRGCTPYLGPCSPALLPRCRC